MAHVSFLKQIARLIILIGLVSVSLPASAATVILNFEWLDPSTNHHGSSITESGYTLTATDISSTKPSYFNSNGTVSIYTELNAELTITYGPTHDYVFDIISMDFGELFSAGTPLAAYSAVRADGSTASGQLVISGASSLWNYHLVFGPLFTNLVSFRLGHNSPYLYQYDNIELRSSIDVMETPIPGALPLYLSGIAAIAFARYRRRRKNQI